MWDRPVATLRHHRDFIYSLHVAGSLIFSGAGDGMLVSWLHMRGRCFGDGLGCVCVCSGAGRKGGSHKRCGTNPFLFYWPLPTCLFPVRIGVELSWHMTSVRLGNRSCYTGSVPMRLQCAALPQRAIDWSRQATTVT